MAMQQQNNVMKTIKIKTTASGLASLQHPNAKAGMGRQCATYDITDCPLDVQTAEVIRLFSGSAILRAPEKPISFAELAVGKIIR